jgi:hypothetical protein
MITAEDFIKDLQTEEDEQGHTLLYKPDVINRMIEFAKLHREAILKEASENADTIYRGDSFGDYIVDKDSILNAYPLENIK